MKAMPADNPAVTTPPRLQVLALFEGMKGTLALIAAASLELIGPGPLRRLIDSLISKFNLDPDSGPLHALLSAIDPAAVNFAAAILALYGVLRLAEAWGLWRGKAWASWLGCVGTAAYLPLDLYGLYYHRGWQAWVVLGLNLLVVWVLARDIRRRRGRRSIAADAEAG